MTAPVTGITPIYGIEYPIQGEPIRTTRSKLERNAKSIEAALQARGVAAANAPDVLAVSGRVSVLETAAAKRPYSVLRGTGTLNILNGTWTALPMGGAEGTQDDPLNGHSATVNTSRWTCPPGEGGFYLAGGTVGYSNTSTAGRRFAGIRKNGVEIAQAENVDVPTTATDYATTGVWPHILAPGDYLELWAFQDSGVASPGLPVLLGSSGFWVARVVVLP